MTEIAISPVISPDISSDQHSADTAFDYERSLKQIQRLKKSLQNQRKPWIEINLDVFTPDRTGRKSFDNICIEQIAGGIFTNSDSNTLDGVDFLSTTLPERIVKIQSGVEGAPVRGGSAHGVTFLQICVQSGECMNAAVKAFQSPTKAFAEFVNTQEIVSRGIQTLTPIAVIIDGEQESDSLGFYLSRMESIRSMDRYRPIKKGYLSLLQSENSEEQLNLVKNIGKSLANMHLLGVFPGDSQLKNFALRNDGSIIPIDFENVDIFNEDFYVTNQEKFIELSVKGLRVLFDSLNGQKMPSINFFQGFKGEKLWEAFREIIFEPYKSTFDEYVLDTMGHGDEALFVNNLDVLYECTQGIESGIKNYILQR